MKLNVHPDSVIGLRKPLGWRWGREADPAANPLKANALRTLQAQFSNVGFATGPIQKRKSFFRLPIHWVYSADRANSRYRYYEPVGAVTVPCLTEDAMTFSYMATCEWPEVFSQYFDRFLEAWSPEDLFSQEGLAEIRRFKNAVKSGKRCAEPAQILRYEWTKRHPELWDDLPALLTDLRRFNLYSSTTPDCQALEHVGLMVSRVRIGLGAEDLKPSAQVPLSQRTYDVPEWTEAEFLEEVAALKARFADLPKRHGRGSSKQLQRMQQEQ